MVILMIFGCSFDSVGVDTYRRILVVVEEWSCVWSFPVHW